MRRADEADDPDTWLGLVPSYQRYVNSGEAERGLVSGIVSHANQSRAKLRTRTGRLVTAQRLEGLVPPQLVERCLSTHADLSSAFALAEIVKARLLLDMMSNLYRPPNETSAAQVGALEEAILAYQPLSYTNDFIEQIQLASILPVVDHGPDPDVRVNKIRELEALAANSGWGFSGVAELPPLSEVQRLLQPNEALLEFVRFTFRIGAGPSLAVIVITCDRVQTVRLSEASLPFESRGTLQVNGGQPTDWTGLGQVVAQLRLHIFKQEDSTALPYLRVLYDYLLRPIAELNGMDSIEHFVIVPTGLLNLVPWTAILPEPSGRHISGSLVPSAAIWARLASRERDLPAKYAGFGDPKVKDRHLPRLKNAGLEVAEFASQLTGWDAAVRIDKEATASAFRSLAPKAGIVHVGAHGDFPENNPLDEHAFLLAPSGGDDGRLTAREIALMDLRSLGIALLNICNGAVYRVGPGDEPYGLAAAMLSSGARNLIAPIWPIADDFARTVAADLAQSLTSCPNIAAAFESVMHRHADDTALVDWAAYSLIGLGRKIDWSGAVSVSEAATGNTLPTGASQ